MTNPRRTPAAEQAARRLDLTPHVRTLQSAPCFTPGLLGNTNAEAGEVQGQSSSQQRFLCSEGRMAEPTTALLSHLCHLGRGLGRGTTWDRLQPSAVKTPASLPQPPRLNRRPAQRPSKRRVSPQGAAAAPTRPGAGRGVVPFPRPGPPPLAQPSPQGSQLTRARVGPQALPGLHRHASQPGQWTCPMSHGQRGTGRVQGGGRAPSNYCWGWGGFLGPCRAGEVGQGSVWPQAFQHFSGKCPDLQFLHKASTV